jgi:hypothetical protein
MTTVIVGFLSCSGGFVFGWLSRCFLYYAIGYEDGWRECVMQLAVDKNMTTPHTPQT